MPLPKPKNNESKDDFLSRCMANSAMNAEYQGEKQRYAVCNSIWEKKEGKAMKPEKQTINQAVKEVRCWDLKGLTLRVKDGEGGKPKIVGYAAIFNSLSENLGGFREKIAPGAFKKAVKGSDARALFNHDSNLVLGRQKVGTLRLKEDETGLWMEIDPPDTQFARDLMTSIERGDIDQQSFGFTVAEDKWEDLNKQEATRTLLEIDKLFDVSPVTFPAYPETSVALRSMESAKAEAGPETVSFTGVFDPESEADLEIKLTPLTDVQERIATALERIVRHIDDRSATAAEPTESANQTIATEAEFENEIDARTFWSMEK